MPAPPPSLHFRFVVGMRNGRGAGIDELRRVHLQYPDPPIPSFFVKTKLLLECLQISFSSSTPCDPKNCKMLLCRGIGRKVRRLLCLAWLSWGGVGLGRGGAACNDISLSLQLSIPVVVLAVLGWILYVIGFAAFNHTDN